MNGTLKKLKKGDSTQISHDTIRRIKSPGPDTLGLTFWPCFVGDMGGLGEI